MRRPGKSTETTSPQARAMADREWWLGRLATVYKPQGAALWLDSPHRLLGGRSAWSLIQEGNIEPVEQLIDQLESGAFV